MFNRALPSAAFMEEIALPAAEAPPKKPVATIPETPAKDAPEGSLEQTLIRALAWTGASMWLTQLVSWVSTLYVARVLAPDDYGVFALATVYLGLVSLVSEFGIGSAVIVMRDLKGKELAGLNTISVIGGLLCFGVSSALALPIGAFFSSSALPPVIVVMSAAFVVAAFRVVPESLLQQDLRFKLLAYVDGTRSLVQAVVTTAAAVYGLHYWSLVAGYLAATLAGTLLVLVCRRHPFAAPRLAALRPALELSRDVLVSRICWYAYSNSDFLIAGKMLGEAALGAYRLAWSVSNIPVDKVSAMVMRTSQAFFSKVQQDHGLLRRYLLGLTEGLSLVTVPVCAGVILEAGDFIHLVLGEKWASVAGPLRLLAVYAAARSITPLVPPILNVTGHSGFVARVFAWTSIVLPAGFYVSSYWGAEGIAAGWIVMYPLSTLPLYRRAFREIGLTCRGYLASLKPALGGTAALAAAVMVLQNYALAESSPALRLTLSAISGSIVYAAFIWIFHRSRVRGLQRLVSALR